MRNAKTHIQVEYLAPESLLPYSGNARVHSKKQLAQISAAIREFGFINPVIARRDNTILAGHGRVEAAKTLAMPTVPVVRVKHLSDAQMRA